MQGVDRWAAVLECAAQQLPVVKAEALAVGAQGRVPPDTGGRGQGLGRYCLALGVRKHFSRRSRDSCDHDFPVGHQSVIEVEEDCADRRRADGHCSILSDGLGVGVRAPRRSPRPQKQTPFWKINRVTGSPSFGR